MEVCTSEFTDEGLKNILKNRGISESNVNLLTTKNVYNFKTLYKYFTQTVDRITYALDNFQRIIVDGDVDFDGAMSGYQLYSLLKYMGGNVKFTLPSKRKHTLSEETLNRIEDCDLVIFVDKASNCDEITKELSKRTDVIVIDHHQYNKTEDKSHMNFINSVDFEYPYNEISCGMLVNILVYNLKEYWGEKHNDISCGASTIISDVCNTGNPFNRAILEEAYKRPTNTLIANLLGKQVMSTKSIGFTVAPRINALMRNERMDLVLKYFTQPTDQVLTTMDEIRKKQREKIKNAAYTVNEKMDKTKLIIINDKSYGNYTGVIASREVQNTCFVLIPKGEGFKGSFRSIDTSFNYREILENEGIYARGHEPAFGIEIKDKKELQKMLEIVDEKYPKVKRKYDIEINKIDEMMNYNLEEIGKFNRYCNGVFNPISFKYNGRYSTNIFASNYIRLNVEGVEIITNQVPKELVIYPIVDELNNIVFHTL